MELLQLKYFLTVARLESVTRAAAYHHIPQPAMSQTIARLEKELGNVRLFDRRNNRIYLNENGKLFKRYVEKALLEIDNGVQAMRTKQENISGAIRVLALEGRRFCFDCVSHFAEKYPHINFSISHDYSGNDGEEYDLCISTVQAHGQMHGSAPLIREPLVLAVHESHPLAQKKSIALRDLQNEKFITMSPRSTLYALTYEHCRSAGFEPHIPFICDDPYYVRTYVSENMGVSLAPAISWAGRFRENTKLVPVTDPPLQMTSYLIWDDKRYLSPAVRMFRDYMLEQAALIDGNLQK